MKESEITNAYTDTRLIIANLFPYCLKVLFRSIFRFFCLVKCSLFLKFAGKAGCTTKLIVFHASAVQGYMEWRREQTKMP